MSTTTLRFLRSAAVALTAIAMAGCHTDMWVQPKHHHPYQQSELFLDGNSSRALEEGTVARGMLRTDRAKYTGYKEGKLVTTLPATIAIEGKQVDTATELRKVLIRGQERFNIFCSHCHGKAGDGKGMITQRGLVLRRPPASYHTDRLRKMPIGHFYDVMTNGYGTMFAQASRVPPDDRWAIAAYIRALQLSQNATGADVSAPQAAGSADGGAKQ